MRQCAYCWHTKMYSLQLYHSIAMYSVYIVLYITVHIDTANWPWALFCSVLYVTVHLYTRSLIHCTHVLFCNTHYKYKQSIVLVDITCDGVLPVSFVPPLNNVYTLQVQLKQVCVCVRIYIINYKKIYQRLSLGRR